MVREAEQHATRQAAAELIEARNQADALMYGTEKDLKEHGSRLGTPTGAPSRGNRRVADGNGRR